jgi:Tol biopolymer transport system component
MAFLRVDAAANSYFLVIANADGGQERVLATRRAPTVFVSLFTGGGPNVRPAWSPDGRTIAVFGGKGLPQTQIVFVNVSTGMEVALESRGSFLPQGVVWQDASSIILSQPATTGAPVQLWRMSYPQGAVSRLTNDLNSYLGPGFDAEHNSLVTSRSDIRASFWVGDGAATRGEEVVPSAPVGSPFVIVGWAGERLFYEASVNGRLSLVSILPGAATAAVEVAPGGFGARATSDGKTIVFMRSGAEDGGIWKSDADGRRPVRLVADDGLLPMITHDDRYVIYLSARGDGQSPWMVPIEGGQPTEIVKTLAGAGTLDISPDGARLLFLSSDAQNQFRFTTCQLPACTNRTTLPLPPNFLYGSTRWTPDGRGIAYVGTGASNIWSVPLDGGQPRQVTHFTDRVIADFAWSRDGRRLAIARTTTTNDIVLFKGLRK